MVLTLLTILGAWFPAAVAIYWLYNKFKDQEKRLQHPTHHDYLEPTDFDTPSKPISKRKTKTADENAIAKDVERQKLNKKALDYSQT